MEEDEKNRIGRLLREAARKSRGHADFFDWPDKQTKEWGIARNLVDAIAQYEGQFFISVDSRPEGHDPPDCEIVDTERRRYGLEITELVDQAAIEFAKRNSAGYYSTEWTEERLILRLTEIITRKDKPFKGPPYFQRALVIHTDEPELDYDQAKKVLSEHFFDRPSHFDVAILFFSYSPRHEGYPLIRLMWSK